MLPRYYVAVFFFYTFVSAGQRNDADSLLDLFIATTEGTQKDQIYFTTSDKLDKIPLIEADNLVAKKLANVDALSYNAIELNRLRSHIYFVNRKIAEGLPFMRQALETAKALGNQMQIGQCNLDMGFYYRDLEFFSFSSEYLGEAARIFSNLGDHRKTGQCYYEAALTSYNAGNLKQSLSEQKESVLYFKKLNEITGTDEFYLMSGYNTMGLIYKRLNQYDASLMFFGLADSLARKSNNIFWTKMLGGNKGEVFVKMGEVRKAVPLFKADYAEMLKHSEARLEMAAALNLAEAYIYLNEPDSAFFVLNQLDEQNQSIGTREQYWKILALAQERKKELNSSIRSLRKAIALQDSARLTSEAYNVSKLKAIYELEQKDESIRALSRNVSEQQASIQRQRIILTGSIIISLLLIALVIVFYRYNRRNKIQLEIIGQQKDEIEEKNAELEMQSESLREINRRVEGMNIRLEERVKERTQELEAALSELNTYLYRASHDLRRPLTTVIGLSKLYYGGQVDRSQIVDMMDKTAYILDRMLKKLQMAHDLEHEQPAPEYVDLLELINKVKLNLLSDSEQNLINFYVKTDNDGPVAILAPRRMLEIIAFNVIENAVVFSIENKLVQPTITITVTQSAENVKISIADNGIGFHTDIKDKIFEQFYRGSEKSKGSGLGLFLVKKSLEKTQGTIDIESQPYHGTTVTVTIPKAEVAV